MWGWSESSNSMFSNPLSKEGSLSRGGCFWEECDSVLTYSFSLFFDDECILAFALDYHFCSTFSFFSACKIQYFSTEGFSHRILILFFGITPSYQLDGDPEVFETGLPFYEVWRVLNFNGLHLSMLSSLFMLEIGRLNASKLRSAWSS